MRKLQVLRFFGQTFLKVSGSHRNISVWLRRKIWQCRMMLTSGKPNSSAKNKYTTLWNSTTFVDNTKNRWITIVLEWGIWTQFLPVARIWKDQSFRLQMPGVYWSFELSITVGQISNFGYKKSQIFFSQDEYIVQRDKVFEILRLTGWLLAMEIVIVILQPYEFFSVKNSSYK